MSMYLCGDCQTFKDDDWHPMSERELCPHCEDLREERHREFIASQVEAHVRETERRSVKQ